MKKCLMFFALITLFSLTPFQMTFAKTSDINLAPYTSTRESLEKITPEDALKRLTDGNKRFVNNNSKQRNLLAQAKATSLKGQFPSAVILSCMDSRGSPELIFDQGLGDIFSVRVAGNVIDSDQLGGMEFATKVMGSKLVVILGHTKCGAIQGACQNVELGNLTQLLNKIQPAAKEIKNKSNGEINCNDYHVVDAIAKQNVIDMIKDTKEHSSIIQDLVKNKQVMIVGAMHDLKTGKVEFFDENGNEIK
jgi:carbonic anhydrase